LDARFNVKVREKPLTNSYLLLVLLVLLASDFLVSIGSLLEFDEGGVCCVRVKLSGGLTAEVAEFVSVLTPAAFKTLSKVGNLFAKRASELGDSRIDIIISFYLTMFKTLSLN
jgi:hypothetical protein